MPTTLPVRPVARTATLDVGYSFLLLIPFLSLLLLLATEFGHGHHVGYAVKLMARQSEAMM